MKSPPANVAASIYYLQHNKPTDPKHTTAGSRNWMPTDVALRFNSSDLSDKVLIPYSILMIYPAFASTM